MKHRLGIGTVQFGMPYGVSRNNDSLDNHEISQILDYAWLNGVNTLDTAISYGDSEKRLGEVGVQNWQVVTKLPAIPEQCADIFTWIYNEIAASCSRLKINKLYGLLLHKPQQLVTDQGHAIYAALIHLKKCGLVEKIGVSIASPDELDVLCPMYEFDLIQAPFNVIDRRLETTGWMDRLKRAGIEIHMRSIFLQGLLLMDQKTRPAKFGRWQSLWLDWHKWLEDNQITAVQACLNFVLSYPQFDRILVGIHSFQHLQEILSINISTVLPNQNLISTDLDLINPSNWSTY